MTDIKLIHTTIFPLTHSFTLWRLVMGLVVGFGTVMGSGCTPSPVPRQRGFHRLELPKQEYQKFESKTCPFTFEYPVYGVIEAQRIDSCFFNIHFPTLGCKWHITTRNFSREKTDYDRAFEDHRQVVYKHAQKGKIYERLVRTDQGFGVFYELYGDVPTSAQVFFSDSSSTAVLTSFYFNTALKNDSLAPVIDLMKKDMEFMVRSLRWK